MAMSAAPEQETESRELCWCQVVQLR